MRPILRSYQADAVNRTRFSFRSHRRTMLVVPTGGGKTVIAGAVIEGAIAKGSRVLFLAHRKELIDQAAEKLCAFDLPHGVIKAGQRQDLAQPVQVASVQTLSRRLDRLLAGPSAAERDMGVVLPQYLPFDLIIVDECHHAMALSYLDILAAYPQARVLGLTATPYRIDGKALGDCFDDLVVGATVPELINTGHLVRTRTYAPPPPEALRDMGTRGGEFRLDEAAKVLDRTGPLREIVATWKLRAADRLTVGFGCTVQHCEDLAQAFRDAGVPAASVDGAMDDAERGRILADLRTGRLRVVFNVALLTEGFDLPELSCLIEARPTKSRCLWRQICGRIMRPAPGKVDGVILDHAANGLRYGIPDQADVYDLHEERERRETRGISIEATQLKCRGCWMVLAVDAMKCPGCGKLVHERAERSTATLRNEVELTELTPADESDQYAFYRGLVDVARSRGKKLGWVFYRYKERWGAEPASWMPVKAGIYRELYNGRECPARLVEIAKQRGNAVEVMA